MQEVPPCCAPPAPGTQYFTENRENRSLQHLFHFSFTYRFDQSGPGKQRKAIQNDDIKSGGSKHGG
ncbi:hypothetical protein GCM10027422_29080 [Hymenobacter arcticus]